MYNFIISSPLSSNSSRIKRTLILCACTWALLACDNQAATQAQLDTESAPAPARLAENLATEQPADLVYPLLDSANSRWFYFDSASRPFGLVNLSPDTQVDGAWGSGYRYNELEIQGFSHVHAWQLAGLSVMPVVSDLPLKQLYEDYFSPFSHDSEIVRPGYHSVELDRYGIKAELSATTRVGMHRYQFPPSSDRKVLLKLSGKLGPSEITDAEVTQLDDHSFAGYITNGATKRRPKETPIFFHIEVEQKITSIDYLTDQQDPTKPLSALVSFQSGDSPLQMKVGISYTSIEGAKNNLQAELNHWDFDRVATEANDDWNQWLNRIAVKGGTQEQRRRFYTDLWHALQGRRIISDADGKYSDQTGAQRLVKQLPLNDHGQPLFNHHNSDSFWGAQWTISTLWPLAYPKTASDFGNSLLQYYRDGGLIPRGPSGGNYTYVMTGASSTPFMVSNWMKGIRDFDADLAYEGLKKNHDIDGIMAKAGYEHGSSVGGGLKYYIERGYIPYPIPEDAAQTDDGYHFHWKGAGQTLEYSFQDAALSKFAQALGHEQDADYYQQRSLNYRNLYDPETGFIRPRTLDGEWQKDYDPYQYQMGFVESNAAQMTWFPVHDVDGLAELMGGKDALIEKLEGEFQKASELEFTSGKAHADESDERYSRIPINYGNQPSMQAAFIFAAAGAPEKTQYWSREVVNEVFSGLDPQSGYNGDEDQGLMGSLAVLMKIGLFQLSAGTEEDPIYWIGSPLFDEITIALDDQYYSGGTFTIKTTNNSDTNRTVRNAKLNGEPLGRHFIYHSEIAAGGTLELEMAELEIDN